MLIVLVEFVWVVDFLRFIAAEREGTASLVHSIAASPSAAFEL